MVWRRISLLYLWVSVVRILTTEAQRTQRK